MSPAAAASERAPLMGKSAAEVKRTPLPMVQLGILCLVMIAEPVALTQIFPYINQMMEDLRVTNDLSKIGFYSGMIDSIFALAEVMTIYYWGRLSDRIGRKPVILFGLAGVAISSICFGLSNSLWTAVISRSMAGALSGNGAVVQCVLAEITDSTNQAQAFPIAGLIWSLGSIAGPLIGGTLSNPATRYPDAFGHIKFFREKPYFLPCLMSAAISLISICIGYFFLEESLPSKKKPRFERKVTSDVITDYGATLSAPTDTLPSPAAGLPAKPVSMRSILSKPSVRAVYITGTMLAFLAIAFEVVFVLFAYTAVGLGGLDRSPAEIGFALASAGLFQACVQLTMFPRLVWRFNTVPLYRALMCFWPILFLSLPLLGILARPNIGTGDPLIDSVILWTAISLILIVSRFASMSFPLHLIMVKDVTPNKELAGAMFGLGQTFGSIARTVGPAFVSSIYAISVDKHIMGNNFVWVVMAAIGIVGIVSALKVTDYDAEAGINDVRKT